MKSRVKKKKAKYQAYFLPSRNRLEETLEKLLDVALTKTIYTYMHTPIPYIPYTILYIDD